MNEFFPGIEKVKYNPNTKHGLHYQYYDPDKVILGKKMSEHLRVAACYWHNFCWDGSDAFGGGTRKTTWGSGDVIQHAFNKADAVFEFIEKLNIPYFTFHDTDVAPEGNNIKEFTSNFTRVIDYFEEKMSLTGIRLLWGTANLFSHSRYQAGAGTNPNPEVFAYAATQVKHAMEATHRLNGDNYVLWGGREGYDTLLNTDLRREKDNFARFLHMVVEHKHKIGFQGQLLIEPKPCEPTKHQYDYDTETVFGFLHKHGLSQEFKVNIEANHATLAGHSFEHEIETACALDFLGSIDANRGDPQNGWDTDQFPNSIEEMTLVIYRLLKSGGFRTGGFNFDSKVRRQSINLEDMFYGHIGGIDVLAKGLIKASEMITHGDICNMTKARYAKWDTGLGKEILLDKHSLDSLSKYAVSIPSPIPVSGQQERFENIVTNLIYK